MQANQKMETFFGKARVGLLGALNSENASAMMETYGYDEERLRALLQKLDEAEIAYRRQKVEYSRKYGATRDRVGLETGLREQLTRHRQLARVKIDTDDNAFDALDLDGRVPVSHDGLVQMAKRFYEHLSQNEALQERLSSLTLTAELAEEGLDQVAELESAKNVQTMGEESAQDATEQRDQLFTELQEEMQDFFEVARIGTHERPQVREALGLVAPSA